MPAQLVIKALGFDPEDLPGAFGAPELKVSRWGTIRADFKTMMTSLDGVFAGGDITRGAGGIRDGRDAVDAITAYLEAKSPALAAAEYAFPDLSGLPVREPCSKI